MHLDVCLYIQDWTLAVDSDSGKINDLVMIVRTIFGK